MTQVSKCRSCDAEIIWAVTRKGKRIPIDHAPVPGGAFLLYLPEETADEQTTADFVGTPNGMYTTHFETCPNAAKLRKEKSADGGQAEMSETSPKRSAHERLSEAMGLIRSVVLDIEARKVGSKE